MNQQLEKRKEVEEREKRKVMAEEKHKEWVQKKNEQVRRKKTHTHTWTCLLQSLLITPLYLGFSCFLLDSFFSNLVFAFSTLMDIYQVSVFWPLLSALLLFPYVAASTCIWLSIAMKSVSLTWPPGVLDLHLLGWQAFLSLKI